MQKSTRRKFVGGVLGAGGVGTVAALMSWMKAEKPAEIPNMPNLPAKTERMPVAFVGHGTPRSAVWTNQWTASWESFGARLPRPSAILVLSRAEAG